MELIKNIKKNTIILILITILVMYFILRKDLVTIIENFQTLDLKYILLAVVFYMVYIILHSYVVYKTINQKEKFSLRESIKHNVIAQFFNGITPFSTGGQPMEIYMLTKHGISVSKSTNYILQNFVFYQIALVLFGIVAVVTNSIYHFFPQVPFLRKLVLLGFIVNTLVAIVILMVSLSKRATRILLKVLINILSKIRIIKNKNKTIENWDKRIQEFHECAEELKKRKSLFIMGIVLNFIGLACLYVIPVFITYSLHNFNSINAIEAMISSAYVMVMGSFIPIPGASGGIEYGYTKFFGNFLNQTQTKTTLLLWRFITYYLGMIIGAIVFNFDQKEEKKEQ